MKDLKISKELLSEVFNQEVRFIKYVANNTYEIHFEKPIRLKYIIINMYELAHKCKEWALTKGYFIYSTHELSFIKSFSLETIETFSNGKDTEIECIIKACEWILENFDLFGIIREKGLI